MKKILIIFLACLVTFSVLSCNNSGTIEATDEEKKDAVKIVAVFSSKGLDDDCYEVTVASDYILVTVVKEFEEVFDGSVVKINSGSIKITDIDLSVPSINAYSSSIKASVDSKSYTLSDLTIAGGASEGLQAYISLKGLVNGHILDYKEEIGTEPASEDEIFAAELIFTGIANLDTKARAEDGSILLYEDETESMAAIVVLKAFEEKVKSGDKEYSVTYNSGAGVECLASYLDVTAGGAYCFNTTIEEKSYELNAVAIESSDIILIAGTINGHTFVTSIN